MSKAALIKKLKGELKKLSWKDSNVKPILQETIKFLERTFDGNVDDHVELLEDKICSLEKELEGSKKSYEGDVIFKRYNPFVDPIVTIDWGLMTGITATQQQANTQEALGRQQAEQALGYTTATRTTSGLRG